MKNSITKYISTYLWKPLNNIICTQQGNVQKEIASYEKTNEACNFNLSQYETRRKEVAESSKQIDGVFYIIDGKIIHDYFSESLVSDALMLDKNYAKYAARFYAYFYQNYLKRKYPHLTDDDTHYPHGRVESGVIFIDTCYFQDEDIINYLCDFYRINGKILVISCSEYKCKTCANVDYGDRLCFTRQIIR